MRNANCRLGFLAISLCLSLQSAIRNSQSEILLDPFPFLPQPRLAGPIAARAVARQGPKLGVDGIQEPARLREEQLLHLRRRGDPVLRPDDRHRCVQGVEGERLNIGGQGMEVAAALAGVRAALLVAVGL